MLLMKTHTDDIKGPVAGPDINVRVTNARAHSRVVQSDVIIIIYYILPGKLPDLHAVITFHAPLGLECTLSL